MPQYHNPNCKDCHHASIFDHDEGLVISHAMDGDFDYLVALRLRRLNAQGEPVPLPLMDALLDIGWRPKE